MGEAAHRDRALREELHSAVRMLQFGLHELRVKDGTDCFYHPFMLTLASGFERLLKAIICLHVRRTSGAYPDRSIFPAGHRGHNLELLLDRVTEECFPPALMESWSAARTDIEVLRTSRKLRRLVQVLSRFAQAARYHHLDIVLGEEPKTGSPEQEWGALQIGIAQQMMAAGPGDLLSAAGQPDVQEQINQEIAARLQTLAGSLARLILLVGNDEQYSAHHDILIPLLSSSDGADDMSRDRRALGVPPGDERA